MDSNADTANRAPGSCQNSEGVQDPYGKALSESRKSHGSTAVSRRKVY